VSLLRVERSPLREFLVGVVGLVLLFAAVDVLWGHWISTAPETTGPGQVTTRGRAMQRADIVWGAAFLLGGGAAFLFALDGLVRRRAVLTVEEDGLEVDVGGTGDRRFVPWEDVRSLRCGLDEGELSGGRPLPVLRLEVVRRGALPAEPRGAVWDGAVLVVDADGWSMPVEEVVVHAELARERHRHLEDGRGEAG